MPKPKVPLERCQMFLGRMSLRQLHMGKAAPIYSLASFDQDQVSNWAENYTLSKRLKLSRGGKLPSIVRGPNMSISSAGPYRT